MVIPGFSWILRDYFGELSTFHVKTIFIIIIINLIDWNLYKADILIIDSPNNDQNQQLKQLLRVALGCSGV